MRPGYMNFGNFKLLNRFSRFISIKHILELYNGTVMLILFFVSRSVHTSHNQKFPSSCQAYQLRPCIDMSFADCQAIGNQLPV